MVWPALLPPWKRTTASARSASRSVTLPFPSSPHWAPTITIDGIRRRVYEAGCGLRRPQVHAPVVSVQGQWVAADLDQPGDGALADLVAQLGVVEVGGDDHGSLVLVARVHDRVELLQHPLARALGADVVDVQQVDAGQALQQPQVRAVRVLVERLADLRQ